MQLTSLQTLSARKRSRAGHRAGPGPPPWCGRLAAVGRCGCGGSRRAGTGASIAGGSRARVRSSFTVAPPAGTRFVETVEADPFALLSPTARSSRWRRSGRMGARASGFAPCRRPSRWALAGTEGADSVFWSPDGRSLGFFAGSKLKRIDVQGRHRRAVVRRARGHWQERHVGTRRTPAVRGGRWGRDLSHLDSRRAARCRREARLRRRELDACSGRRFFRTASASVSGKDFSQRTTDARGGRGRRRAK